MLPTATTLFTQIRLKISQRSTPIAVLTALTLLLSTLTGHSANAELIDLSPDEPTIQFAASEARWVRAPDLSKLSKIYCCEDMDMEFLLYVNQQGRIINVDVIKGSGHRRVDALAIRQLRMARLKPFVQNGKPVAALVRLPVKFGSR